MMDKILAETRFYFAQCVFNTSCHYAAVERYQKQRSERQKIALWLSSGSVVLLVLTILGWELEWQWLLRFLSFIGLLSTAASLIFEIYNREDLTEFMCYHKVTAENYKGLRDNFMNLIRLIMTKADTCKIEPVLEKYLEEYKMIGKFSPATTGGDYSSAQKKLGLKNQGEAFTWSNEEIDRFLPEELRLSK